MELLAKGTQAKDKITGRTGTVICEEPITQEIKNKAGEHLKDETIYILKSDSGHKFVVAEENIEEITSKS